MKDIMFWKDSVSSNSRGYEFQGGFYYRTFELNKFIKKLSEEKGEVVGLRIDGNNMEIIIKGKEGLSND